MLMLIEGFDFFCCMLLFFIAGVCSVWLVWERVVLWFEKLGKGGVVVRL